MLSLKTGAALLITLIIAVVAYVASSQLADNLSVLILLPSIFTIITTVSLMLVSSAIQGKQTTITHSSNDAVSKPAPTPAANKSANTNGIATLYVGNLAYKANEKTVQEFFETVGSVRSVRLVKDKKSGRRKGFGFVEVNASDENMFISKMNEAEFMERNIIVRPANEKQH